MLWLLPLISRTAFLAFSSSLQAMITRAPRKANATAVSFPIPQFPPETYSLKHLSHNGSPLQDNTDSRITQRDMIHTNVI